MSVDKQLEHAQENVQESRIQFESAVIELERKIGIAPEIAGELLRAPVRLASKHPIQFAGAFFATGLVLGALGIWKQRSKTSTQPS